MEHYTYYDYVDTQGQRSWTCVMCYSITGTSIQSWLLWAGSMATKSFRPSDSQERMTNLKASEGAGTEAGIHEVNYKSALMGNY